LPDAELEGNRYRTGNYSNEFEALAEKVEHSSLKESPQDSIAWSGTSRI
jgi:hypothetical protein